eukprot:GHVR01005540.1.p1 GENE.GHVR01005540.1~~GHVR01005540.1.p1  ORF type:complete len:186 (+),score=76.85 GHVR01005540.1:171-728(+)
MSIDTDTHTFKHSLRVARKLTEKQIYIGNKNKNNIHTHNIIHITSQYLLFFLKIIIIIPIVYVCMFIHWIFVTEELNYFIPIHTHTHTYTHTHHFHSVQRARSLQWIDESPCVWFFRVCIWRNRLMLLYMLCVLVLGMCIILSLAHILRRTVAYDDWKRCMLAEANIESKTDAHTHTHTHNTIAL